MPAAQGEFRDPGARRARPTAVRVAAVGVALVALLAACDRSSAPDASAETAPQPTPDFTGTWAARPQLCRTAPWLIEPDYILAATGPACVVRDLRPDATGWAATADCAQEGPAVLHFNRLQTTPRSLVISGGPWRTQITLVACAASAEGPERRRPRALLDRAAQIDLQIARGDSALTVARAPANAAVSAVWRRDGEIIKVIEPIVGGPAAPAERAYYYEPGARQPILVRDPRGAFGFQDGRLSIRYGPHGEPQDVADSQAQSDAEALLRQAETTRALATALRPQPPH